MKHYNDYTLSELKTALGEVKREIQVHPGSRIIPAHLQEEYALIKKKIEDEEYVISKKEK